MVFPTETDSETFSFKGKVKCYNYQNILTSITKKMNETDLGLNNDRRPVEGCPDTISPRKQVIQQVELETEEQPEVTQPSQSTGKQFKLTVEGLVLGHFRTKYIMSDMNGQFILSSKAEHNDFIICNNKYDLTEKNVIGRLRKVVTGNMRQYILNDNTKTVVQGPPAIEPKKALLHIVSGPTHTHAFRNANMIPSEAIDSSDNDSGDGVDVLEICQTKADFLKSRRNFEVKDYQGKVLMVFGKGKDKQYEGRIIEPEKLTNMETMALVLFAFSDN